MFGEIAPKTIGKFGWSRAGGPSAPYFGLANFDADVDLSGTLLTRWTQVTGNADTRFWEVAVTASTNQGSWTLRIKNDAYTTAKNIFSVLRFNNVLQSLTFGNATDNPTYAFTGTGTATFSGKVVSSLATGGIGYNATARGSVAQATSRTTGVTINFACGNITLVSAAGTTTWQTFTVTNSVVVGGDTVIVSQASGTDLYQIFVTNVSTGSFKISFATTGGTTTEQPVFNFAIIKCN